MNGVSIWFSNCCSLVSPILLPSGRIDHGGGMDWKRTIRRCSIELQKKSRTRPLARRVRLELSSALFCFLLPSTTPILTRINEYLRALVLSLDPCTTPHYIMARSRFIQLAAVLLSFFLASAFSQKGMPFIREIPLPLSQ